MEHFEKDFVFKKTFEYFGGDELATKVWISKYCLTDNNEHYLEYSPPMMFDRLAKEFYRIENNYKNPLSYDEIATLLQDFKYVIPGGSILYGLGNNYSISSLGNCFVIGNQADSYGGILTTDQEQIQLAKRRAGVGHDLSHIRSKGSPTTNSSKTSTGIVPFMRRYSNSILEVAQEGRRGALLLSINIDHPEVENFITAKDKKGEIEGANISVKVTDSFMEDLRNDVPKARKIWNKMVHQAWKSAEPGLLFIDTIQRESPADCYKDFETISTNPCGEIPLCQYDSCRLISINLSSFVIEPFAKVENTFKNFNFNLLDRVAYAAQKLMDDIVDLEYEKIIKILKKVESDPEADEIKAIEKNLWTKVIKKLNRGRRTGLSGIGLADVFASLNIKYDSDEALILTKEIYRHIALASYRSSIDMARDRGSFPDFDYFREQHNPFINRITKGLEKSKVSEYLSFGRRNIANLTVPPSGSISLLGGISSGIEPVFSVVHKRRRKVDDSWEEHLVLHRGFLRWLKSFDSNAGLSDLEIREALKEYSKEDLEKLIKKSPYYNSTAHEIDNNYKIKLQSIIQNWVDHSINLCPYKVIYR